MGIQEAIADVLRRIAEERGTGNMPWDPMAADQATPAAPSFASPVGLLSNQALNYPTQPEMETYTDYSQGFPQQMTRPKAQFGDLPQVARPADPGMQAQAPLTAANMGPLGGGNPFSLGAPPAPPQKAELPPTDAVEPSGFAPGEPVPLPAARPAGAPGPLVAANDEGPDGGNIPAAAQPAVGAVPGVQPMGIGAPPEKSFFETLRDGAKSAAPAFLGVGAALSGDHGAMTAALLKQQQELGGGNATAQALLAKGAALPDVRAAIHSPDLMKALIAQYFGKDKFTVVKTGADQFGNERYGTMNSATGEIRPLTGGAAATGAGNDGPGYLAKGVTQVDQNLSGDDYLNQYSPEVRAAVMKYVNGESMPTGNPRKGWTQQIKVIAQKYGSDTGIPVDDTTFSQRRTYRNQLASGSSASVGGQIGGFRQGLNHAEHLIDYGMDLNNSSGGGIPIIAHGINSTRQALSTDQTTKANKVSQAAQLLAGEVGKLFSGSQGGGVQERRETMERFKPNMSPSELSGAIGATIEMMQGGLEKLQAQRSQILGPNSGNVLTDADQARVARITEKLEKLKAGITPTSAPGPVAGKTSSGVSWSVVPQ